MCLEAGRRRYAQVNCTLRSMFAAHGIGRSANVGRLEKAMEVVCGDKEQTNLELSMSGCEELVDITPLAKLAELQSLQQLTLDLRLCENLPSRWLKKFTNLADFLAACESGALRLVLRSLPRRNPIEENPIVILNFLEFGCMM